MATNSINMLFQELSILNYDILQIKLIDIENIKIVEKYIKNNNIKDINPKVLLASLLLKNDSKISNKELFELATILVKHIIEKKDCDNLIKEYNDKFLDWQKADKEQNKKIIHNVKLQVSEIMKKSFWDKIYQDLSVKNNEHVMLVIEDLKEKIKSLCLSEKMKKQIDAQFDTKIIKQIIDNDDMTKEDFELFFYPLYLTVKSLQSPGNDDALNTAYLKILNEENWKISFVSSLKVLTEAVSEIYVDLIKLSS